MLPSIAIVRSMRAWALVHSLAQTWTQIGRNPAAALGSIAPNIGSIVAIEKDPERLPSQIFPTFLALNSGGAAGPRLPFGTVWAVQGGSLHQGHCEHHERGRPGRHGRALEPARPA